MASTKKSDDASQKCCNCASSVGPAARVSPVFVTDKEVGAADGPKRECWCPRCFVWKRMLLEPERFDARFVTAVTCQFCGFASVCFTTRKGGADCGYCGRGGAMLIRPQQGELDAIFKAIREQAEEQRGKA